MSVLVSEAVYNGNTERGKPAYRSKNIVLLCRLPNILIGAVPSVLRDSETPEESTCLEDDLNSTVLDPPASSVYFNVYATLVSLISY